MGISVHAYLFSFCEIRALFFVSALHTEIIKNDSNAGSHIQRRQNNEQVRKKTKSIGIYIFNSHISKKGTKKQIDDP
jgi:hypothetical protein